MLVDPRFWLFACAGWLIATGLAHTGAHVWSFVLEEGMVGQREFAMRAMKQAFSTDPLEPSMWRQFRMFSMSFGLLLLSNGAVAALLARIRAPARVLRGYALFGTVFWTLAFIPFAFVDPVFQAIVVAIVAVPLHAVAWITANEAAGVSSGPSDGDSDEP